MQKALVIFLFTWAACLLAGAQEQDGYHTIDQVVQGISKGNQKAADVLLNRISKIKASDTWTDDTRDDYINSLGLLSVYNYGGGHYREQETLIEEAIQFFGQRDSVYNNSYMRRLWLFRLQLLNAMKDYDTAQDYGRAAMSLYENANDRGVDYGQLCLAMSNACARKGELLKAKLYVDEALDAMRRHEATSGQKDAGYYTALNFRGMVNFDMGRNDQAIADFKEVVANTSPEDLVTPYGVALNNLCMAYANSGQASESIKLLEQVKETSTDLQSAKFLNLAIAHLMTGNKVVAAEYLEKYNRMAVEDAVRVVANFAEVEREAYLKTQNQEWVLSNAIIATQDSLAAKTAFDMNVFSRQISLSANRTIRMRYQGSSAFEQYQSLRQKLIAGGLSPEERDSIRIDIIQLEKQMVRSDSTVAKSLHLDARAFNKISTSLSKHETMVLFCLAPVLKSFGDYDPCYGAFVIRKGDTMPKLVHLGQVDEVIKLFIHKKTPEEFISERYSIGGSQSLYQLLWQPLEQYLKKSDRVYYSTAGGLEAINFEVLADRHGKRLSDKYDMILLSSPTEKKQVVQRIKPNDFVAFGAPALNLPVDKMTISTLACAQTGREDYLQSYRFRGEMLRGDWQDLPGTRREVKTILERMCLKGVHATAYLGEDAREENFKALSGHSPRILHVATHGFAITDQKQYDNSAFARMVSSVSANNDYMLWSGLVLAGGNAAWRGDTIPDGVEDGILTAEEIARLDLSGTDLVVLSACGTALGHVSPYEGVWGLRRAFKQAGAKAVLMTLWKVSDDITALFMERFYKHLLAGKTIRQSVKLSQDYLIAHGASDPFYWAPFVVMD